MTETPEDFADRFARLLPRSNDLTLVVLKGQLLTEELIDTFLHNALENAAALKPARLEFFQRLCVLRALLPKEFEDVLDAVEKLNELRNKLAHNLEPPQIEDRVEAFLRLLEDPGLSRDAKAAVALPRRLKSCLAFLCGQIHGMQKANAAILASRRRR